MFCEFKIILSKSIVLKAGRSTPRLWLCSLAGCEDRMIQRLWIYNTELAHSECSINLLKIPVTIVSDFSIFVFFCIKMYHKQILHQKVLQSLPRHFLRCYILSSKWRAYQNVTLPLSLRILGSDHGRVCLCDKWSRRCGLPSEEFSPRARIKVYRVPKVRRRAPPSCCCLPPPTRSQTLVFWDWRDTGCWGVHQRKMPGMVFGKVCQEVMKR